MTDAQVKHMVERFLQWKLPADFHPDCGIHFDADAAVKMNPQNGRYEPVGTNLFTAIQAEAMVRYMADALPLAPGGDVGREEWRPIETAPKDGEPVLGWAESERKGWKDIGTFYVTWMHGDRWCFFSSERNGRWNWEPTYWQPLPKPPEPAP